MFSQKVGFRVNSSGNVKETWRNTTKNRSFFCWLGCVPSIRVADGAPSYIVIVWSDLQFPHVCLVCVFGQINVFFRDTRCTFVVDNTDACYEAQSIAWQNLVRLNHVCVWSSSLFGVVLFPGLEHTCTQSHDRNDIKTNIHKILQVPGHFFQPCRVVPPQLTRSAAIPSPGHWASTLQDTICLIFQCMQLLKYVICAQTVVSGMLYYLHLYFYISFLLAEFLRLDAIVTCLRVTTSQDYPFLARLPERMAFSQRWGRGFGWRSEGCLSHKIQTQSPTQGHGTWWMPFIFIIYKIPSHFGSLLG